MYPDPVSAQCKLTQLVARPRQQILSSKCVYVDIFETKMLCRCFIGLRTEDSLTHTGTPLADLLILINSVGACQLTTSCASLAQCTVNIQWISWLLAHS